MAHRYTYETDEPRSLVVTKPGETPQTIDCPSGVAIVAGPRSGEPPPPPPCTWTVTPTALSFVAGGAQQPVLVAANREGCPWTTSGSTAWLTLDPMATGVNVTALPNTGAARSATITVAGHQISVSQAAAVVTPPPPPPTGRVLAQLNVTAGSSPTMPSTNWGYWGANPWHEMRKAAGNGFRVNMRHGGATGLTQYYAGYGTTLPTLSPVPEAIYVRMHLTIHSPFEARGVGDTWTDKFLIINDPNSSVRAIMEMRPHGPIGAPHLRFQKNIEGPGTYQAPERQLPLDRTVALQLEVRRGANGRLAFWIDNPNQASPTSVSGVFNWAIPSWQNIRIGFYNNASIASGAHVEFSVEDLVVTDAFDPLFR